MAENKIIIDEGDGENLEMYQPEVDLISLEGFIQIRFTRKTADAVNIYKRQPGNESWDFIATAVNSPFDDHESEESWEYCVRGVKDNKEIGIPKIVSAFIH